MFSSAVPTRRELLAWMLALTLALSTVALMRGGPIADAGVTGPTTEVVYIATGEQFPDALAAAANASLGIGPVLLVRHDSIPQATLDELNRLQPARIVIMGETEAISAGVQAQLVALAFSPEVTRIGGPTRYETAAELSAAFYPTSGLYPRAGGAEADAATPGTGAAETLLIVTVEAPAPGILLIDANVGFERDAAGAVEDVECALRLSEETDPIASSVRSVTSSPEENGLCATLGSLNVAEGTHTIQLRVAASADIDLVGRALTVLWVPFDAFGATP